MRNEAFLELKEITKKYHELKTLDGFSMKIYPGEIHAVAGENASGKTTLLNIIAGITPFDGGQMFIEGHPYKPDTPAVANRHGIHYVMGIPALIDNVSVAENVMYGKYPRSKMGFIRWKELFATCSELFAGLHVDIDPHALAGSLNIRQKRMAELIRAYYANTNLLMIDEPDFSKDEPGFAIMQQIFRQINARGGCVLVTSHHLQTMLSIADRITIIEGGRLRFSEKSTETSRKEAFCILAGNAGGRNVYPKIKGAAKHTVLRLEDVRTDAGLEHVTLDISRGEILGVFAQSPSMRTALPRALYGLDSIRQGRMLMDGKPVMFHTPGDALARGIGYLPEDRDETGLQSIFPIPQNISLANLKEVQRSGLLQKWREMKAARIYIRRFNIKMESMRQSVSKLSSGNQQKVLLSRLLFSDCRILILEEPTKNIDAATKNEIYNFMNSFVKNGGAIILVSSFVEELVGMCDQVLVFGRNGMYATFNRVEANKEVILSAGE